MKLKGKSVVNLTSVVIFQFFLVNTAYSEAFVARGDLLNYTDEIYSLDLVGGTFEALVTFDSSLPRTGPNVLPNQESSYWRDSVLSVQYTLFDSDGILRLQDTVYPAGDFQLLSQRTSITNNLSNTFDLIAWSIARYNYNPTLLDNISLYWVPTHGNEDLVTNVLDYPSPLDTVGGIGRITRTIGTYTDHMFHFFGAIREVELFEPDADGDGIEDAIDSCINSDLSDHVAYGNSQSQVPNYLFQDGCTVNDVLDILGGSAKNHGQFISQVSEHTRALVDQGEISSKERSEIQKTVATSK